MPLNNVFPSLLPSSSFIRLPFLMAIPPSQIHLHGHLLQPFPTMVIIPTPSSKLTPSPLSSTNEFQWNETKDKTYSSRSIQKAAWWRQRHEMKGGRVTWFVKGGQCKAGGSNRITKSQKGMRHWTNGKQEWTHHLSSHKRRWMLKKDMEDMPNQTWWYGIWPWLYHGNHHSSSHFWGKRSRLHFSKWAFCKRE